MATQWQLPDLSDLTTRTALDHVMNIIFRGAGTGDPRTDVLVKSFLRLVDKAVREYELARQEAGSAGGDVLPLIRASGHLENCITSMKRSLRFAEALFRSNADIPRPKCLSVFSSHAEKTVTVLRDAIEHMDKRIIKNELRPEDALTPYLNGSLLELAGSRVSITELAGWLRQLHNFGVALSDYRPGIR